MLSRGDVYLLGEAYAFGVVWSFFLKSLGVLVLRYHRHDQEYKIPINLHIAGTRDSRSAWSSPRSCSFLVAIANLFSKQIATIYGVAFTVVLLRHLHDFRAHQRAGSWRNKKAGLEEFNLDMQPEVTAETVHARPGCVLVAVRDYNQHAAPAQRAARRPTCGATTSS